MNLIYYESVISHCLWVAFCISKKVSNTNKTSLPVQDTGAILQLNVQMSTYGRVQHLVSMKPTNNKGKLHNKTKPQSYKNI